jgi:hypothetical protein
MSAGAGLALVCVRSCLVRSRSSQLASAVHFTRTRAGRFPNTKLDASTKHPPESSECPSQSTGDTQSLSLLASATLSRGSRVESWVST